jgi:hypothetical protein
VSIAAGDGGSVCPSTPLASRWKTDLRSVRYWSAWSAFAAWALRCDHYNLFNAWWMILLAFWLTANEVDPAHTVSRRLRSVSIGVATAGAAFLIYGTFEWLQLIADGRSWGPPGQWLWVVAIPLRAIAVSAVTAVVLVPQLRRHFGLYSVALLMIAALSVGIFDFGSVLITAVQWREQWEASCIELFIVLILPMTLAAASERLKEVRWPTGYAASALSRWWRGTCPLK